MHISVSGNHSLAERAYRWLEEQLVTLEFAPGELIGEKELVEKAGIGRTPVREAVQRLSTEGLLQVLPRKGLMVTPLRRSDLTRILEARKVLERLMVVKAAERATPDQQQDLRELAADIEEAQDDLGVYLGLDQSLDGLLRDACDNRFLVKPLTTMQSHCRRLWYFFRRSMDLSRTTRLRGGLARAVADGDGVVAIRASDESIAFLESLLTSLDDFS